MPGGAERTVESDNPNCLVPLCTTVDFPVPGAPTTAMVTGSTLSPKGLDYQ